MKTTEMQRGELSTEFLTQDLVIGASMCVSEETEDKADGRQHLLAGGGPEEGECLATPFDR